MEVGFRRGGRACGAALCTLVSRKQVARSGNLRRACGRLGVEASLAYNDARSGAIVVMGILCHHRGTVTEP